MKNRPIAVFDSGLGGISVLRELVRQMPREDFLYFGDSAKAPYGSRSTEEIRDLTLRHAEQFFSQGAKALVVACNTATSAAILPLRERWEDKIIIGIEPALKPAVDRFPGGKILVMATEATLREEKFAALLEKYGGDCEISKCPCPGLVEFVERGDLDSPELLSQLKSLLEGHFSPSPDAIVLGCTHYPFLEKAIRLVMGNKPLFFNGADGTAKEAKRRLEEAGLLNEQGEGKVILENSLGTEEIHTLGNFLLHI